MKFAAGMRFITLKSLRGTFCSPGSKDGSSLKTAEAGLGTGCRISHIATQINYCVLTLCCNMRTELTHLEKDFCCGQVFLHPGEECCYLAGSARPVCATVRLAARRRVLCVVQSDHNRQERVLRMPELLCKLGFESTFPVRQRARCWGAW